MNSDSEYNNPEIRDVFFNECRELAENMERSLLILEENPSDEEAINAVFRVAHTIKGTSGMFGFHILEQFTHSMEMLLNEVRSGTLSITTEMITLLLDSHDFIVSYIHTLEENPKNDTDEAITASDKLMNRIQTFIPLKGREPEKKESVEQKDTDKAGSAKVKNKYWHLSIRFGENIFKRGTDPQSLIAYLREKGEIKNIKTLKSTIPPLLELDPENCYLGFEIDFDGKTTKEELEEIFKFVKDDSLITILPPYSKIEEYITLIDALPEKPMSIGEILKEIGSLTENELEEALSIKSRDDNKYIGEILVDQHMAQEQVIDAALEKQRKVTTKSAIKIDPDKLDNLINLVGEIIITEANVREHALQTGDIDLNERLEVLSKHIEDLRERSMSLRMVPTGDSFNHFKRLVRDMSIANGKEIELAIKGSEIELDKVLIDRVMDPLVHIIRNAVDHGIEKPAEREKLDKNRKGLITVDIFYETGHIVISITDDGKGIDSEKILEKAIKIGMIEKDKAASLSENEILEFIFEPGFSTAETVTKLSGRGVGMDVVKRNIESLSGSIAIDSTVGTGTVINIYLPQTLSIMDGFQVEIGSSNYILPLDLVIECLEVDSSIIDSSSNSGLIQLRDEIIPVVQLKSFFGIATQSKTESQYLVIVAHAGKRAGFLVDNVIGEIQTVIKPLSKIFSGVSWFNGGTILSNGNVSLILNIAKLIQIIQTSESEKAKT